MECVPIDALLLPDQTQRLCFLEGLQPAPDAELHVDLLHVPFHRSFGESESLANFLVLEP